MNVNRLDHLVLTVASIDVTVDFYTRILGMEAITFGTGRMALRFGTSKINLHEAGSEFEPKALRPTPGSADICLIVDDDIATVIAEVTGAGVTIEEGPVDRTGATSASRSRLAYRLCSHSSSRITCRHLSTVCGSVVWPGLSGGMQTRSSSCGVSAAMVCFTASIRS